MNDAIGIIGGSGVYSLDGVEIVREHEIKTPFGSTSDAVLELKINGVLCFFIPRHKRDHSILPHEVNYRANIYALKMLGVRYLISVSAVGSLVEECPPETFVLPDQFIDWTKGQRERSFLGHGIVGHVSVANPVDLTLQKIIEEACQEEKVPTKTGGSYICIEGPQFSSKAESTIYRSFGATVIGMTNVPEAYLAKEAAMAYATIAMVTDFDNWKEEHCQVEEIMKVMKTNNANVQKVLKNALKRLSDRKFHVEKENKHAIMTSLESLNENQRAIVDMLHK